MTTSTIVLIVVVAVVAILLIATIAWVARNKRTQHRRVEAGNIRDKAAEQSHQGEDGVGPQSFVQPVPGEYPGKRGHEEHEADLGEEREVSARSS